MEFLKRVLELGYVTIVKLPVILKLVVFYIYWELTLNYYRIFNYSLYDLFTKTVKKYPNKKCLIGVDGSSYTFEQLDKTTNHIANGILKFFSDQNNGSFNHADYDGRSVAILTENTPMVLVCWLSMYKIGLSSALLNFNLKKDALKFCFESVSPFLVLYDKANENLVEELDLTIPKICVDDFPSNSERSFYLNNIILSVDDQPPLYKHKFLENILFIFTSGTTGLPKAAVIKSSRFFTFGISGFFADITCDDSLYITIPLYHSNSGVLCVSLMMLFGCSLIIRKKFSTSSFISDCLKYKATGFNYVGELCRYLMSAPIHQDEKKLNLRLAIGNGLRSSVWSNLVERFCIKTVGEFYGSTEGSAGSMNMDSTVGCCGFIPPIFKMFHPVTLVKFDPVTKQIIRNLNGRAVVSCNDEPGMAIVKINMKNPLKRYDGYTDKKESDKKVAFGLFREKDSYFVTGDVLKLDKFGHLYFVDRTGDTFRWKGENVSTTEVENVIMKNLSNYISDSIVYGVEVGNNEGKAGMVAVNPSSEDFNYEEFFKAFINVCNVLLVFYSRPIFIRILKYTFTTSTFKFDKVTLMKDGYNPENSDDKLFYLNSKSKKFELIDNEIYNQIINNQILF